MSEFELVWDSRCGVAESPVWDAATRRLLFCDIPGKRINALSVDDGSRALVGLARGGRQFRTVPLRTAGRRAAPSRRAVRSAHRRDQRTSPNRSTSRPTNRFNDGKVGPDGCFWVGSMDESPPRQKTGALYRVSGDGRVEKKAEGYAVSNGLAWSPDGRTMYHSDSTAGDHRGLGFRRRQRASEQSSRAGHADQRGRPP